ncbi:MAG: sigma-54 dependent transcriptional regulator [Desulfobacteraceae bacterium]|jgi:two-component system NtrC family response regulator
METGCILVVDDEKVICDACSMILKEHGYSVDVRMTGRNGLNAALEGEYDLVLLDMKLPDIDGIDILREVREEHPRTYVIVMTGYSTVKNAVDAMKLGAFDYLAKPFEDDELTLAVNKALEKKHLVDENVTLRKELYDQFSFSNIVGEDPKILRIFDQIEKVAPMDSTVLLYGESGTGKELFVRAIHARSQRAGKPFVAVDCSTLSPSLLESELFGHTKGAFTGAVTDKAGVFQVADRGTLFIDEVANLSLEIQGKLLRVLETQEYKPVGASKTRKTSARIIAATNRDLKLMVADGGFREDLYYRLNVFPLSIPPLRDRRGDIPKLAYHFLHQFCRKTGKRIEGFSNDALETLVTYDWPGNVRQLKNVVERLVIMSEGGTMDLPYLLDHLQSKSTLADQDVPESAAELKARKKAFIEEHFGRIEKAFALKALKAANGNITRAAERVGMKRPNFHTLMKKHNISADEVRKTGTKEA